jgi:hypothetical protein
LALNTLEFYSYKVLSESMQYFFKFLKFSSLS